MRSLRTVPAALRSGRRRRGAVALFVLLLLLATAAAFGNAQRLKLERSPVTAPRLDRVVGPTCVCEHATARLEIRLRRGDVVDAGIVDAGGTEVRSLATGVRRDAGPVAFSWNGRDDAGAVVPDGRYRLRVRLEEARRTITIPTRIRVDATPPRIRLASAAPQVISPDGDGRRDRIRYAYRLNELARALVAVDGDEVVRGRLEPAGAGRTRWQGRLGGAPAPVGTYETWLVAEDEAGNLSEPTRTVPVRVRYVELVGLPRRVRPGGRIRFTVDADARQVTVRLVSRPDGGGVGEPLLVEPGPVSLRAPRARGRYAVHVSTHAHTARAPLRVARR